MVISNGRVIKKTVAKKTVRKSKTATVTIAPEKIEQLIAQKAYELYELRGRVDGYNNEDWFQAQQIIQLELGLVGKRNI